MERFFWNCFNTTIRATKCYLNLFKSSRISCRSEKVNISNTDVAKTLFVVAGVAVAVVAAVFVPVVFIVCKNVQAS